MGEGISTDMVGSFAQRVVEPFVPWNLRLDPEARRVARLVVAATVTATPIMLGVASARWIVEGSGSRIGAIIALTACMFLVVPFVLRITASLRLGATMVLSSGVLGLAAIALAEDGLDSEALLWMSLVPIAAALLRGVQAVVPWSGITLGAMAIVVARDMSIAHASRVSALWLDTASAAGAVIFAAVLARSYETERARSVRELEARERRWRAFVQAMPDALIRVDATGRIVDAHLPPSLASLHRTSNDVIDREVASALPAEIGARVLALIADARQRGLTVLEDAFAVESAQLQLVVVPLFEGDTLAILRDVSALASAERERALSEKRADLLAASLRERDEFLTVASHELRTPLTAMKLWLQGAERISPSEVERIPARLREAHARIAQQVSRLSLLIEELLDVSRLLEHRLELEVAPLRLDELAREIATRFEAEAAKHACDLECDLERVEGEWDRSRVDQVVTNLLSNALKYAPGKPITLGVHATANEARITVRDRGVGIDRGDQGRIFERFERLPGTRRAWGLGLGLWISRGLVLSMGGRIEVESRLGEGSTFTVILPMRRPIAANST